MILAPRPLYVAQEAAAWGLTELQDQQLAGLIMWVPAGLAYVAALAWLFMKWMQDAERQALKHAMRFAATLSLAIVMSALLSACDDSETARAQSATFARSASFGGDPERGVAVMRQFGCGACHTILGVTGANGLVGPPLTHMARRVYVAGLLRNTPDNLMHWLMNPQQVVPGNAMPNMGLSRKQARDVAAYLYTLQ
jgi:cytochrome c2